MLKKTRRTTQQLKNLKTYKIELAKKFGILDLGNVIVNIRIKKEVEGLFQVQLKDNSFKITYKNL